MEVHHHPDLHHKEKAWKEYLLEFFMIFLAVTLGFFAETFREKITESNREKDYMTGLISNIQSDTANLRGLIDRNDLELRGIDSLLKISKNNLSNVAVQDSIFYYALQYSFSLHMFQFNDLTLVQLRNAGGYSVIKTSKVADSIALYESKNNEIQIQGKFYIDYAGLAMTSFKQLFDGTLTSSFFDNYNLDHKIPSNIPVLFSSDKEKIHVLLNNYWSLEGVIGQYNKLLKQHVVYLGELIAFLKNTYGIM